MSRALFAYTGDVDRLDPAATRALLGRDLEDDPAVRAQVAAIIGRVRRDGDRALCELAAEFDGVLLDALEVSRPRRARALDRTPRPVRQALERAARNIRDVHAAFAPVARAFTTADGVRIERRPDPLGRVGVYAPGGRAAYPSSVLMGAVPARVAGVSEVLLCSPPARGSSEPSDLVLAAAEIASVDRVFALGGAGAVAALAFGTASVPQVDLIVGPGNAWVAAAKLQVAGVVRIDAPAGPSEILILADRTASAVTLAREIVAQAEHDSLAAVVLVSTDPALAEEVGRAVESLLARAPRAEIIRVALAARGALLAAASLEAAVAFADRWAPEHLLLALNPAAAETARAKLRTSGTIVLGDGASVAFGDYLTGANHVLPTGGLARAWSGLSTSDFVRWTTSQWIDRGTARALSEDTALLADAEGLPGHAAAARQWGDA